MADLHPSEEIDFQKYWTIIKRHWLPAMGVAMVPLLLFIYLALSTEKKYEASGKLKFKKENVTSSLVTEAGEKIGRLDALGIQNTPLDTEAEVLKSAPIIQRAIETLKLKNKEGKLLEYEDFLKNLTVKDIPGTDILTISYKSPNPQEARSIVDRVMEVSMRDNIRVNRSEAASAKNFIGQQIPIAEKNLKQAENNLENFKTRNQIVDLSAEASLIVQQIGQLDQQIGQIQAELAKTQAQAGEFREKVGVSSKEAIARSDLNKSLAVQQVRAKLQEIESRLAIERTRFTEVHPRIIDLKKEKATLEKLLNQRVNEAIAQPQNNARVSQPLDLQDTLTENLVNNEAASQGLLQQLASLTQTRAALTRRAKLIPRLEQQQAVLGRQLAIAQTSYQALIKNQQELEITEKQQVGNARVVSSAVVSKYPKSPRLLLLVLGIVVGSLLYLITAFLLELTDRSLKTTAEVRKLFPYPWLGSVPQTPKTLKSWSGRQQPPRSTLTLKERPESIDSEAYRRLVTEIQGFHPERNIRIMVITSSIPEEGKSTISANLALANAERGKRVLLIDADLRHPCQQNIWQLVSDRGLSHILEGKASLSLATRSVGKNLDVLLVGDRFLNPLASLESEAMKALLAESVGVYDLVIIDTPPLLWTTDALTIGHFADGIILVAKPNVLAKNHATATREILQKSSTKILGLITNGVSLDNEFDRYLQFSKHYIQNGNCDRKNKEFARIINYRS
jgi:polysaccharide biosynthesis transport protein